MRKYKILDFIEYTKENKNKFINYCEIIINPYGSVIIAEPSHIEAVVSYGMEKENKTREEINSEIPITSLPLEWCVNKYGLIAVWYNGYMYSSKGINRFQRRSLDILIKNGLIKEDYVRTTEYSLHLKRKDMGIEPKCTIEVTMDNNINNIINVGKEITTEEALKNTIPVKWSEDVLKGNYKDKPIIKSKD